MILINKYEFSKKLNLLFDVTVSTETIDVNIVGISLFFLGRETEPMPLIDLKLYTLGLCGENALKKTFTRE